VLSCSILAEECFLVLNCFHDYCPCNVFRSHCCTFMLQREAKNDFLMAKPAPVDEESVHACGEIGGVKENGTDRYLQACLVLSGPV
jgi:hypothetical protein